MALKAMPVSGRSWAASRRTAVACQSPNARCRWSTASPSSRMEQAGAAEAALPWLLFEQPSLHSNVRDGQHAAGQRSSHTLRASTALPGEACCCCCETQTRTLSGPPSTGASIAMDGGERRVLRRGERRNTGKKTPGEPGHTGRKSHGRTRAYVPVGRAFLFYMYWYSTNGLCCVNSETRHRGSEQPNLGKALGAKAVRV